MNMMMMLIMMMMMMTTEEIKSNSVRLGLRGEVFYTSLLLQLKETQTLTVA